MKVSWSLAVGITGLTLIMSMGPSWGQVPPENDKSQSVENTGGGSGALDGAEIQGAAMASEAEKISEMLCLSMLGSMKTDGNESRKDLTRYFSLSGTAES